MAPMGQLVVSTGDLPSRLNVWINRKSFAELQSSTKDDSPSSYYPRPNMQDTYVAPRNETEQSVAEIWQQMLGIERVGVEDNFFNLGGHSLLATRLVGRLRPV